MRDVVDGLLVRGMEVRDAPEVAALCGQLGYERSSVEVHAWVAGLDSRSRGQAAFVAVLGAEVVGWIEVSIVEHLQTPAHALIGGLVVKDGVRGVGVGRALCEAVEHWSWETGVEALRVTSRSTREGAHRFYLRQEYREVKRSHVFEKGRPSEWKASAAGR